MFLSDIRLAFKLFGLFEYEQVLRHSANRKWKLPARKSHDMPAPPWKEAASIIIASRAPLHDLVGTDLAGIISATKWKTGSRCDYRLLMVKRSSLSSYMANAYVYPGGLVELADYSPRWYDVFETLGVSRDTLQTFCTSVTGPRPTMITTPSTLAGADRKGQSFLPADIALRIAAIRETFEETGILLLTKPPKEGNKISSDLLFSMKGENSNLDLAIWRDRIHEDPLNFIDLCLETKTCPNLWSLYEWWNWLTPTSVGHRRYDTMFYLCCLDKQPEVVLDQGEVITLKWCTPEAMLEEHSTNGVFLAPPQVYELSRMYHLSTYTQLQQFAQNRMKEGVEQWLPIIATAKDGALSLLPGDDMYPKKPDYVGRSPGPDLPYTLEDLRQRARRLNRMEVQGPICTSFCNITPPCGHLQPLTYRSTQPLVHSYL